MGITLRCPFLILMFYFLFRLFHIFPPAPCPIFTPLCVQVLGPTCAFSFYLWYTPVDAAKSDTLFCCKIVKKNTVLSPVSLHLHKFLTSSDSQFNVCCKQNEEEKRRKGGRVEVFYKRNKMAREGRK
uniref:Uncharacterized protein n=1 Tax=Micrurus spixii TaxID=129469 RepID=A0A2D4NH81_9SAUR